MHAHEFEKPTDGSIVEPALLGLPSHRVGYSDRTAWLMATMSQLAYLRFESTQTITEIAAELAEMSGRDQIVQYLRDILAGLDDQSSDGRRRLLAEQSGTATQPRQSNVRNLRLKPTRLHNQHD